MILLQYEIPKHYMPAADEYNSQASRFLAHTEQADKERSTVRKTGSPPKSAGIFVPFSSHPQPYGRCGAPHGHFFNFFLYSPPLNC